MKTEYLIIKEENTFCNSKETFINLLATNGEISVTPKIIKHKNFEVKYVLNTGVVKGKKKDERHFTVLLERDTSKGKLDGVITKFTEVNRIFKKIIKESNYDFRVITLWDDVSVYYSHKAYPLINEIENLMRKLIFKFMFTNVGMDWLEAAAPKDFRESVQKKVDKNKVKDIIENSLYEADFIHLASMLFKEYPTVNLNELIRKIKKAKKSSDIDFKDLEELVPKSNWDKYFAAHIELDGLKEKWEKLYELRNKIAHNKPIHVGDYEHIVQLTGEIKPKLEKALTERIEVPEDEKKDISDSVTADIISPAVSGTEKDAQFLSNLIASRILNRRNSDYFNFRKQNHRKWWDPYSSRSPYDYWSEIYSYMKICESCGKLFPKGENESEGDDLCNECKHMGHK